MKKVNLLSKAEMKKVVGGGVDTSACQNQITDIICRDPYFNTVYITSGLGCSEISMLNACGWGSKCEYPNIDGCWTPATSSCSCGVS